ncbi:ArnT family glycosyltransferase [Chlamydiota bacterium]
MDITKKRAALYVLLIIIMILLIRIPSILWGGIYNEDEATSMLLGSKIVEGGILYKEAIDARGPVTYYMYALVQAFFGNYNVQAIHAFLTFLLLLITVLIFFLCSLISSRKAGCLAALFFGVFSFTYHSGSMLAFHTEWTLIFFSVMAVYCFIRAILFQRKIFIFLSGLSFSCAFFSKQPALYDLLATLIFYCFYCFIERKRFLLFFKNILLLLSGFFVFGLFWISFFWINDAVADFYHYFWVRNVKYYVGTVPLLKKILWPILSIGGAGYFLKVNFLLLIGFIFSGLAFIKQIIVKKWGNKEIKNYTVLCVFLWGLFGYLGVSLGTRDFGHYYIQLLPPFCIASSIGLFYLYDLSNNIHNAKDKALLRWFITVVIIIGLLLPMSTYLKDYLYRNRTIRNRFLGTFFQKIAENENWKVAKKVIDYIKENSTEKDSIFVWGHYPELYIWTQRKAASRFVYCEDQTGLIPWINVAADLDTSDKIVPGAWGKLMDDLTRSKPLFIIDTAPSNHSYFSKYPIENYSLLNQFMKKYYELDKEIFKGNQMYYRLFKRKEK